MLHKKLQHNKCLLKWKVAITKDISILNFSKKIADREVGPWVKFALQQIEWLVKESKLKATSARLFLEQINKIWSAWFAG